MKSSSNDLAFWDTINHVNVLVPAQKMRQYLVWDSEGYSESTDTVVEDLFQAVDEDSDSESCDRKRKKDSGKKDKTRRKHSSGSDEGDASSAESSDDDEKAWRNQH